MHVTVRLTFLRPSNEFPHLCDAQSTLHIDSPSIRRDSDGLSDMVDMDRRDRQSVCYRLERRRCYRRLRCRRRKCRPQSPQQARGCRQTKRDFAVDRRR